MSSYISIFLKSELTCMPRLLHKFIGNYYNNTLCNGATWMFVIWWCLHNMFEWFLKAFFKRTKIKEYLSKRLVNSLWYLSFYGAALFYCGVLIYQNEMELFNLKKMHLPLTLNLPSSLVSGYTLLSTFYLHSSLWEGVNNGLFGLMVGYFLLGCFFIISYILRIIEISYTLTSLISIAQILIEITRLTTMFSNQDMFMVYIFLNTLLIMAVIIYVLIYIFIIPLSIIVPMGLKITSDYPNTLIIVLVFTNTLWLFVELYNSLVYKLIHHWLFHQDETNKMCTTIDCSLFQFQDDFTYILKQCQQRVKAKQDKIMSLRKPKNKSMLLQTLKCMVAIKRKITEKRLSENLSDLSDSENSEENNEEQEKDFEKQKDDFSNKDLNTDLKKQNLKEDENNTSRP